MNKTLALYRRELDYGHDVGNNKYQFVIRVNMNNTITWPHFTLQYLNRTRVLSRFSVLFCGCVYLFYGIVWDTFYYYMAIDFNFVVQLVVAPNNIFANVIWEKEKLDSMRTTKQY